MTDPKPQYVVRLEGRGLLWLLFSLAVLATAWFAVVLYGETQDFGSDPGRWAGIPTFLWGLIAAVIVVGLLAYEVALLTIREHPGQLYRLEDEYATAPDGTPATPSFLQPQDEAPPVDAAVEPEPAPAPTDEPAAPPQG